MHYLAKSDIPDKIELLKFKFKRDKNKFYIIWKFKNEIFNEKKVTKSSRIFVYYIHFVRVRKSGVFPCEIRRALTTGLIWHLAYNYKQAKIQQAKIQPKMWHFLNNLAFLTYPPRSYYTFSQASDMSSDLLGHIRKRKRDEPPSTLNLSSASNYMPGLGNCFEKSKNGSHFHVEI